MTRRPYVQARPCRRPRTPGGTPGNPRTPSGCPALAQLMTDARLARHMFQHEVATALGVQPQRVAAWENVRRPVDWRHAKDLIALLDPEGLWRLEAFRVPTRSGDYARVADTAGPAP